MGDRSTKGYSVCGGIDSFALGGEVKLLLTSETWAIHTSESLEAKQKGVDEAAPLSRCTHLFGFRGMSHLSIVGVC